MEIKLKAVFAMLFAAAIAPLASAETFSFSFNGGGITSSGILTAILAPDDTTGVVTPDTFEVTDIMGTFSDTNVGISGNITGLYMPISYVTVLAATASNPVGFTIGGLSYDDLFFPLGNSPADCPGYPFSGGDFDILGVAFNVSDGSVGEFFSDGNVPGIPGPVYAAADTNAAGLTDNPNAGGDSGLVGVTGSFTATPEPGTLLLLGSGLALAAVMRRRAAASR